MPFTREEPLKAIISALGQIESTCRLEGAIGLNDSKVLAQHFFCELLNALHGLDLKVLDRIKPSFPAIDLGDSVKKRCFQISSTKTADKVQETLDKFSEYDLQPEFGQLEIFVIGEPQDTYKNVTVPPGINFDVTKHIKGMKALTREIEEHLGTGRMQQLVEVINAEIAKLPVAVTDRRARMEKHDIECFRIADGILSEVDLTKVLDRLTTDDSYYASDYRKLDAFRHFLGQEQNAFMIPSIADTIRALGESLWQLERFVGTEFFVYPRGQTEKHCLAPWLNVDREGKGLPDEHEPYRTKRDELDRLVFDVKRCYREWRRQIRDQLFI